MINIFYYKNHLHIPKIIYFKIISIHNNDSLANDLRIKKTRKLIAKKYFWPTFCQNVKVYIKSYDICLTSKVVYL